MRKAIGAAALVVALMAAPAVATVNGDGGDDRLAGSRFSDTLNGGGGSDLLLGHAGTDELFGGAGADVIKGGRGFDVCHVTPHDITRSCEVLLAPAATVRR